MQQDSLKDHLFTHLKQLEVAATFKNLVTMYPIGKDGSVIPHLEDGIDISRGAFVKENDKQPCFSDGFEAEIALNSLHPRNTRTECKTI